MNKLKYVFMLFMFIAITFCAEYNQRYPNYRQNYKQNYRRPYGQSEYSNYQESNYQDSNYDDGSYQNKKKADPDMDLLKLTPEEEAEMNGEFDRAPNRPPIKTGSWLGPGVAGLLFGIIPLVSLVAS